MSDDGYSFSGGEQKYKNHRAISGGGTDLDFSVIFDALADDRRRLALYYLKDNDPACLEGVAEYVSAWEQETSVEDVSAETCEHVLLDLYHHHLPKLAETGIVEYDWRTGNLRYREPPAFLDNLLNQTEVIELPER